MIIKGTFTAAFGKSEVQFSFQDTVTNVYLSCLTTEIPVCQGSLNWFSVYLLPKGFVLYLDIQSNIASVKWVVETIDEFSG